MIFFQLYEALSILAFSPYRKGRLSALLKHAGQKTLLSYGNWRLKSQYLCIGKYRRFYSHN